VFEERVGGDPVAMAEFHELSQSLAALQQRILQARMVPIATVSDQLHRAVRDLAKALGKDVKWEVEGGDTELDRGVLHHLGDSLLHLVRNAVDHGIETPGERVAAGKPPDATLRLRATQTGSELVIAVEDDGRGIDVAAVRRAAARRGVPVSSGDEDGLQLVFTPGLSTAGAVSAVSGRGVGLDAVRTAIEAVNGRIELESDVSRGTTFRLIVPVSLAVTPCLIVRAGADVFAVPMHRVLRAQSGPEVHVTHAEGREVIWHNERPVALASLAAVVGVAGDGPADGPVVVLAGSTRRYAFRVDALVGRRDLLAKGLGAHLPKSEVVSGATVAADGSVLLVLDIDGLIERARRTVGVVESAPADTVAPARGSLLVVDDAMTIRELQRAILERSGFRVRTAANGEDALAQLRSEPADLVLTDVEMPVMDGFELTSAIRSDPVLAHTPVLILTSLSAEADRQRGLDAGADGYIVKSGFDEKALVDAVDALLGTAA
jgi:two-component system chemotaxis sensor kinase CheA